jgi:nucleoid DNA-binding protein
MNKLQLIRALKNATDLSKTEAAAIVGIFFNEDAYLINGNR